MRLDSKIKGHIIESYWLTWVNSLEGNFNHHVYLKDENNKEIDFVSINTDGSFKTLDEMKYKEKVSQSDVNAMMKYKSDKRFYEQNMEMKILGVRVISIKDIRGD